MRESESGKETEREKGESFGRNAGSPAQVFIPKFPLIVVCALTYVCDRECVCGEVGRQALISAFFSCVYSYTVFTPSRQQAGGDIRDAVEVEENGCFASHSNPLFD